MFMTTLITKNYDHYFKCTGKLFLEMNVNLYQNSWCHCYSSKCYYYCYVIVRPLTLLGLVDAIYKQYF